MARISKLTCQALAVVVLLALQASAMETPRHTGCTTPGCKEQDESKILEVPEGFVNTRQLKQTFVTTTTTGGCALTGLQQQSNLLKADVAANVLGLLKLNVNARVGSGETATVICPDGTRVAAVCQFNGQFTFSCPGTVFFSPVGTTTVIQPSSTVTTFNCPAGSILVNGRCVSGCSSNSLLTLNVQLGGSNPAPSTVSPNTAITLLCNGAPTLTPGQAVCTSGGTFTIVQPVCSCPAGFASSNGACVRSGTTVIVPQQTTVIVPQTTACPTSGLTLQLNVQLGSTTPLPSTLPSGSTRTLICSGVPTITPGRVTCQNGQVSITQPVCGCPSGFTLVNGVCTRTTVQPQAVGCSSNTLLLSASFSLGGGGAVPAVSNQGTVFSIVCTQSPTITPGRAVCTNGAFSITPPVCGCDQANGFFPDGNGNCVKGCFYTAFTQSVVNFYYSSGFAVFGTIPVNARNSQVIQVTCTGFGVQSSQGTATCNNGAYTFSCDCDATQGFVRNALTGQCVQASGSSSTCTPAALTAITGGGVISSANPQPVYGAGSTVNIACGRTNVVDGTGRATCTSTGWSVTNVVNCACRNGFVLISGACVPGTAASNVCTADSLDTAINDLVASSDLLLTGISLDGPVTPGTVLRNLGCDFDTDTDFPIQAGIGQATCNVDGSFTARCQCFTNLGFQSDGNGGCTRMAMADDGGEDPVIDTGNFAEDAALCTVMNFQQAVADFSNNFGISVDRAEALRFRNTAITKQVVRLDCEGAGGTAVCVRGFGYDVQCDA